MDCIFKICQIVASIKCDLSISQFFGCNFWRIFCYLKPLCGEGRGAAGSSLRGADPNNLWSGSAPRAWTFYLIVILRSGLDSPSNHFGGSAWAGFEALRLLSSLNRCWMAPTWATTKFLFEEAEKTLLGELKGKMNTFKYLINDWLIINGLHFGGSAWSIFET